MAFGSQALFRFETIRKIGLQYAEPLIQSGITDMTLGASFNLVKKKTCLTFTKNLPYCIKFHPVCPPKPHLLSISLT